MLGKVLTIAGNAFRETVRQPVFCVVLAVGGALIAVSPTLSMFTLMEGVKLVQDMGLSTILLTGLLLAVLSASNVVTEEIRGRTALMVVARPVGRGEFVLGKFLGLVLAEFAAAYLLMIVLTLTVRVGVPEAVTSPIDMAAIVGEVAAVVGAVAVALGANYFFDKPFASAVVFAGLAFFSAVFFGLAFFDSNLRPVGFFSAMDGDTVRACLALFPVLAVLTGAAVACATRLNLVTSVVICSLLFVAGILSEYLFGRFAATSLAARVPYTLLPSFQAFWLGDALAGGKAIPWGYVGTAAGYGALYSAALVFLGMMLFERREIA